MLHGADHATHEDRESSDTQSTSPGWGAARLDPVHATFEAKTLADTPGPTYEDLVAGST
ncbi:hypothetical protein GCM10010433_11780 [Streptomyces pulveraceus]